MQNLVKKFKKVKIFRKVQNILWALFARTDLKEVEVRPDLKILVYKNTKDGPSEYIAKNKTYEKVVTHYFTKFVQRDFIVFDIGANIGWFSLLGSRLVGGNGHVYSFEPEKLNFDVLRKNIELNNIDNVVTINKAVSNINGSVKLNINAKNRGAHTLLPTPDKYKSCLVEAITIDSFVSDNNTYPDVIKIDVEGAEPQVFDGMKTLLEKSKKLIIFSEFNPFFIKNGGGSPEKYIDNFLNQNFKLFYFSSKKEKLEPIISANDAVLSCQDGSYLNILCVKN
ncbi:MAG TPA: FkbM family methyltransferase [Candidatus Omnitrophota bacterium]|nr:FkbM family methyltransferase [Candidatus Omnitrophota bacterium]HQO57379.1 FkbM family methyltransferase [Candidatus Omnitrophota bacterium]